MDKFYNNEPIEINICDLLEKICEIDGEDLAKILNVPSGVIGYARTRGTTTKRVVEFSKKLDIPVEYFSKVTNLDISEIEKYY